MTPTVDLQSVERQLILVVQLLATLKRGLPHLSANDRALALSQVDELTVLVGKLKASLQSFDLNHLAPAGNS